MVKTDKHNPKSTRLLVKRDGDAWVPFELEVLSVVVRVQLPGVFVAFAVRCLLLCCPFFAVCSVQLHI